MIVVFDTNIWIFALREEAQWPACALLLNHLHQLKLVVPRQVLRELQANLTPAEFRLLFQHLNLWPQQIQISWDKANEQTIRKYLQLGYKLGDATVSAHLEELQINFLISQNRAFLEEIPNLPFERWNAEKLLNYLLNEI